MKTIKFLPTLGLIFSVLMVGSLLFWGCEKLPSIPPTQPPTQPKVEMSVAPSGILPYGTVCTISWSSSDAKTVTLNRKTVGPTGSTADRLFKDTVYTLTATNEYLSAKSEIEVKVGDWTSSFYGLVSYYPWKLKELQIILQSNNAVVFKDEIPEEDREKRFYYHKNGDLVTNFLSYTAKWSISDDGKYMMRKGDWEKFTVDQKELIFYQEITWYGQPAYFLNILEHASNTPTDK